MKKLSILCFFLATFFGASATHIVGGSISYELISGNEYKIKLEVLRDCFGGNPNAYFDNPAAIGIFDQNDTLVQQLLVPLTGIDDTISLNVQNSVCSFPASICIHRTIYEVTAILPLNMDGYTLAYQRCCRTGSLVNVVNSLESGMTFFTTLDLEQENTSPIFNSDIPFAVFSETAFVYDGSATDPDGDSLVYELASPFLGASAEFPLPQPPNAPPYAPLNFILPTYSVNNMLGGNYPLTINSITGEMVAIPPYLGVFQIGYKVNEYRNGTLIGTTQREFIFYVTAFDQGLSYDLSGTVLLENGDPVDIAKVQILERNISNDSLSIFTEQSINANGEYNFQGIPPGVFYVKAVLNPNSIYFDDYIPTYYNNASFWYSADPINQCDTSQQYRDIYLIPTGGPLGVNSFDGYVIAEDTGEPVADLSLILTNEDDAPIQQRTTNSEGYFKFENLPSGSFSIQGDLSNSALLNEFPPVLNLPINDTVTINLSEDRLSVDETTAVINLNDSEVYKVTVFPNPTEDEINLKVDFNQQDLISINVYNTQGLLIWKNLGPKTVSSGLYSRNVDLENHPSGVYFLEIVGEKGSVFRKIVKHK